MGIFDFGKPNVERLEKARDAEGLVKALAYQKADDVRRKAAYALINFKVPEQYHGDLARALTDPDPYVRRCVAMILINTSYRDDAVKALLFILKNADDHVRKQVESALEKTMDARDAERLIRALKDEEAPVRIFAATMLGDIKDRCTVEALAHALRDKDGLVRSRVANALAQINDHRAVEPLIRALDDHAGDEIALGMALKRITDRGAIEPLMRGLKSRDVVRVHVIDALGNFHSPEVARVLINEYNDKGNPRTVRERLLKALGEVGDASAFETIALACNDKEAGIRFNARNAMQKINDPRAVRLVEEMKSVGGGTPVPDPDRPIY